MMSCSSSSSAKSKSSSDPMAKSSQLDSVSASGRITRVSETFAYIKSSKYGGVFVPPSAVLPKEVQVNPDLTTHLKSGDIVHFTAVAQKGKNDCKYLATKVVVSKNTSEMQASYLGFTDTKLSDSATEKEDIPAESESTDATPLNANSNESSGSLLDQLGRIVTVNETFGYIACEEMQEGVFFPGCAYQQLPGEPNRLNAVFAPNDLVVFNARPQPEMNGCCWIAESVAKLVFVQDQSCGNQLAQFFPPGTIQADVEPKAVSGTGTVMSLSPFYGLIDSGELGHIYFSALAWVGAGNDGAAESLVEVLSVGDEVMFTALSQQQHTGCVWRATKVLSVSSGKHQSCQTLPVRILKKTTEKAKSVRDAKSQTVITLDSLLFRALKSDPELYQCCRKKFPSLMEFSEQLSS